MGVDTSDHGQRRYSTGFRNVVELYAFQNSKSRRFLSARRMPVPKHARFVSRLSFVALLFGFVRDLRCTRGVGAS